MSAKRDQYKLEIEVATEYLADQSEPDEQQFTFAYRVTIRNVGSVAAQLISRHWIIEDAAGQIIEVKGLGVVGQQPLIEPGEKFSYTSGTQLHSATGARHGSYFFVGVDGHRFDVDIPIFALNRPGTLH